MKEIYCERCGIKIDDINSNKNNGKYNQFICCDDCLNLYGKLRSIIDNSKIENIMLVNHIFWNYKKYN